MTLYFLYVDPGSGSYLVQLIIAAILGAIFWIKNSWLYIKSFFTGKENDLIKKSNKKNTN